MSLAKGRHYLAIPGPSVMPDEVLAAMHRPAPNIYFGELVELTQGLVPDLKTVAGGSDHFAYYISNGHGLWEASLTNMISRCDKVLVCTTGAFGHGWAEVAERLGAQVEILEFGTQTPAQPDKLEAALRADTAHEIKAVLCVHVDTATSLRNDIRGLRDAIDAAAHPALFAVDCIASLGCDRFEMTNWGVDVMIAASQKGLMTPPGMGFIWFSQKAYDVGHGADLRTPYWDWEARTEPEQLYHYFDGTPPTHHLYGLRVATDMLLEEGMEAVWKRHATLARAYWAAAQTWGEGGALRLNVAKPEHRSHAVTSLGLAGNDGTRLREWLTDNMGVTLGISLGMADWQSPEWHSYFRIGHMGHVNAHMVLGVCGAIEAGFTALGIDHGAGGAAAAGQVLAAAAEPERASCQEATCCS